MHRGLDTVRRFGLVYVVETKMRVKIGIFFQINQSDAHSFRDSRYLNEQ